MAYTYKFIDCDNNIIRVGFTTQSIKKRIEKYYTGNDIEKESIKNMSSIEYVEFKTQEEAFDFEGLLLSLHKPKYNITTHEYQLHDSFSNVSWVKYNNNDVWKPICQPKKQAENILNYYRKQLNDNNICKTIKYKFRSLRSIKNKDGKYGKYHNEHGCNYDLVVEVYGGYDYYWDRVENYFYRCLFNNVIIENHQYLALGDYHSCTINKDGEILFCIDLCNDWIIFDGDLITSLSKKYDEIQRMYSISEKILGELNDKLNYKN